MTVDTAVNDRAPTWEFETAIVLDLSPAHPATPSALRSFFALLEFLDRQFRCSYSIVGCDIIQCTSDQVHSNTMDNGILCVLIAPTQVSVCFHNNV